MGKNRLHHACGNDNTPYDYIEKLIREYPKALEEYDNNLCTPLHIACANKSIFLDVIQLLYENYRDAIVKQNKAGHLPLHVACKNFHSDSVIIQFLIQQYPDAIKAQDYLGYYPLHLACKHMQSYAVIGLLVREYGMAVQANNNINRSFPLHLACEYQSYELVLLLLLEQYPMATRERDLNGSYPLHLLCKCTYIPSETMIRSLYATYPKAIQERDKDGRYPLHIACYYKQLGSVIIFLFEQWRYALFLNDHANNTPLDLARNPFDSKRSTYIVKWLQNCVDGIENQVEQNDVTMEMKESNIAQLRDLLSSKWRIAMDWTKIQQLIQSDNELIQTRIDDNGYVLHYACWRHAPSDFVIDLINAFPMAVELKDNNGFYPLHYACEGNQTLSAIQLLIEKAPQAVFEKPKYGLYPFHVACECHQSLSVIKLLHGIYPTVISEKTKKGLYPIHLACRANAPIQIIQYLVQEWPNSVYIRDNCKRTPLDYAKDPGPDRIPNQEAIGWLDDYIKSDKFYYLSAPIAPYISEDNKDLYEDNPFAVPDITIKTPFGIEVACSDQTNDTNESSRSCFDGVINKLGRNLHMFVIGLVKSIRNTWNRITEYCNSQYMAPNQS